MRTINATATKRITRRKFGKTGPTITIAEKGDSIRVNISNTIMPDESVTRVVTIYPEGLTMGYALTHDEIAYDPAEADANASSARQYRISI